MLEPAPELPATVLGPMALAYQPSNVIHRFKKLITNSFALLFCIRVLNAKSSKGAYTSFLFVHIFNFLKRGSTPNTQVIFFFNMAVICS